ncbi:hypothetical protein [Polaromonas sp.]|uniref:hypothetical protein n=1 Tax=Polaromonas sp. TaxID=1869339 RepID=UPI00352AD7A1
MKFLKTFMPFFVSTRGATPGGGARSAPVGRPRESRRGSREDLKSKLHEIITKTVLGTNVDAHLFKVKTVAAGHDGQDVVVLIDLAELLENSVSNAIAGSITRRARRSLDIEVMGVYWRGVAGPKFKSKNACVQVAGVTAFAGLAEPLAVDIPLDIALLAKVASENAHPVAARHSQELMNFRETARRVTGPAPLGLT